VTTSSSATAPTGLRAGWGRASLPASASRRSSTIPRRRGIGALLRPNTSVVVVEAPGSLTFEMQTFRPSPRRAPARRARRDGQHLATPLYFKAFEHGVDVSVQAATKYVVGHSDAMVGTVTVTREAWPRLKATHVDLGQTADRTTSTSRSAACAPWPRG